MNLGRSELVKEILWLYHEQAGYETIMGDIEFAGDPAEHLEADQSEESQFVRDGCLVAIVALASGCIDGAHGWSGLVRCKTVLEFLSSRVPELFADDIVDEDAMKLIETALLAVKHAERGAGESPELGDRMQWVHDHYVKGYFRRWVCLFDEPTGT